MTTAGARGLGGGDFAGRCEAPAFNVLDDSSRRRVLRSAEEMRSRVIVQVPVQTVRAFGAEAPVAEANRQYFAAFGAAWKAE